MIEPILFDNPTAIQIPDHLSRFHNTTNLQGSELKERQFRAGKMNKRVLDFFRSHSYENYTPWEVHKALGVNSAPITSIRRAITDLTTMDYLVRTNIQRPGQWKEKCYAWRLR